MAQAKSEQQKAEEKAAAAARKEQAEKEERIAEEKLKKKRAEQLTIIGNAITNLGEALQSTEDLQTRRDALDSHLAGFYDEISRLAKGRGMSLEKVTDLAVEHINDIIRDAKKIVEGDPHLDRVKQFVPAGDNPVYPDVVVIARDVRESLKRCKEALSERLEAIESALREANTISIAIQCFQVDEGKIPTKERIKPYVDSIAHNWFKKSDYLDDPPFDFDRLDRLDLETYFSQYQFEDDENQDNGDDEDDSDDSSEGDEEEREEDDEG